MGGVADRSRDIPTDVSCDRAGGIGVELTESRAQRTGIGEGVDTGVELGGVPLEVSMGVERAGEPSLSFLSFSITGCASRLSQRLVMLFSIWDMRFEMVDARLDAMEVRLDAIDTRLGFSQLCTYSSHSLRASSSTFGFGFMAFSRSSTDPPNLRRAVFLRLILVKVSARDF